MWIEKECAGISFRYCPKCGRLERKFPEWHEYPRRQINPLLGYEVESLGYHQIVKDHFDQHHEVPSVGRMFECWVCGKSPLNPAIRWSKWPEFYVTLCWDCYRQLPATISDFHESVRCLRNQKGG